MSDDTLTITTIIYVAKLAHLPLRDEECNKLLPQLSAILGFVAKLLDQTPNDVPITSQVTGLVNVLREDIVDTARGLTQKEALANAKETYKGFFKVRGILD